MLDLLKSLSLSMFSFFDEMLIVFQKFKYQLLTLILCNCTKIYCIFLQLFQAGIIYYLFNKKKNTAETSSSLKSINQLICY